MCGIAGFIDSKLSNESANVVLEKMLQSISHRGPDARGVYNNNSVWLGHNRLSIIDLSEEANQPFNYEKYVIIFNGEIYNYLEIKSDLIRQGHSFRTNSDTEVICAAYKKWGADCVKQFVGMWAFVIYDTDSGDIFCSRDRFGIKPFYYMLSDGRFYFASEIKALKQSPIFRNDINLKQVARGLQLGWLSYDDETYFEKIKQLPAAHSLKLRVGSSGFGVNRYWDVNTGISSKFNFEEKKNTFRKLFEDSIRLHLRSDVPVASCLSGGLDSSAIVSMVQELNPNHPYKSFSIYYDESGDVDERPFIDEVIKKYPAIEPYYFKPTNNDVAEAFAQAMYHADVPASGSSFISQYFLMKLIAKHKIKVVLDGQGSDEYLGGYMHTFYRIVADRMAQLKFSSALNISKQVNTAQGKSSSALFAHLGKSAMSLFCDEQKLYSTEYKHYHPFTANISSSKKVFDLEKTSGNKTDNFLYHLLFTTSLPSLLQYEDRNSMAFSIESRVPFLDHRLVEFAFTLSNADKINGITTKFILRESLKDILPDAVYNRKDKKGFVTPGENKWLRGPLSHLLDANFTRNNLLGKERVKQLVDEYKKGNNAHAQLIWRIASLNYWIKNVA